MSRSLLSLLKNWFGPMPMANSVVPGALARVARQALDRGGRRPGELLDGLCGSKWSAYSLHQIEHRPAADLRAVLSVTSTRLRAAGVDHVECAPTWSRVSGLGALASRSHHT